MITRPTPSPRVAENAYKTLTVGEGFCESFVATLGLIRRGYVSSKNGEYRIRRITGLKLGSQRM